MHPLIRATRPALALLVLMSLLLAGCRQELKPAPEPVTPQQEALRKAKKGE